MVWMWQMPSLIGYGRFVREVDIYTGLDVPSKPGKWSDMEM